MASINAYHLAGLSQPTDSKASTVVYHFNTAFTQLESWVPKDKTIVITDTNIAAAHAGLLAGWTTIVIPAGEQHKQQATVDRIIQQLMDLGADRSYWLVGFGGGVVTDMVGYVAGIYMRGIQVAFVPTTILAMVDAAIGGKNGVDVGPFKNLVGLIRQPAFLLFDYTLLSTLPQVQWVNGFAEIIKHAAIQDEELFQELEKTKLADFQQDLHLLDGLIRKNVAIKTKVVLTDEFEKGDRKLLNFGHTWGHAIENTHQLLHGFAISIGMVVAANISVAVNQLPESALQRLIQLLQRYELPVQLSVNKAAAWQLLQLDKKKSGTQFSYVLLDAIGKASYQSIENTTLKELIFNQP